MKNHEYQVRAIPTAHFLSRATAALLASFAEKLVGGGSLKQSSIQLGILAFSSLAAIAITIACLVHGITIVFSHIYYIPIVYAAYYYLRRGVVISAGLGAIYLSLVALLTPETPEIVFAAVIRVVVFLAIAAIVATLAARLRAAVAAECEEQERLQELNREVRSRERWYRAIYEQSPIAIGVYNAEGRLTHANPAALDLMGVKDLDSLRGFPLFEDPNLPEDKKRQLMEGRTTHYQAQFDFEKVRSRNLYPTSRSGVIWLDRLITPIRDDGDSIIGYLVHAYEITERKKAEDALRESEEMFRTVAQSAYDAIVMIDSEGRVTFWNMAAVKMFGYSEEEARGRPVHDLIAPEYVQEAAEAGLRNFAITGTGPVIGRPLERTARRKDGGVFPVELTISPVLTGGAWHAVAVIRDVSERKEAEAALRKAHRQLQILTGITRHDILNSITAADGYMELYKDADPADREAYLEKVHLAIHKIQRQIEFTRQYEAIGTLEPGWQSLETIIRGLEVPPSISLQTSGIKREIYADPMLKQVFENLLDNTQRHGGAGVSRITVTAEVSDGDLLVTWEDDGVGVSEVDKKRIFERGFGKHTGLGLFLSREILALTGITITETGIPGRGARFVIRVPYGKWRDAEEE
jgi:PAS domain S-box-containing protein